MAQQVEFDEGNNIGIRLKKVFKRMPGMEKKVDFCRTGTGESVRKATGGGGAEDSAGIRFVKIVYFWRFLARSGADVE